MLSLGAIDQVCFIFANLLESHLGLTLVKILIRNKIENIIAERIHKSKSIRLWIKFLTIYIQRLAELKM